MKLLITRPSQLAETTVSKLAAMGHDCLLEPLLEIFPLHTQPPVAQSSKHSWRGLLVTSSNATSFLSERFEPSIPILTTGEATKTGLESAGFCNVTSANGSALDLAAKVPHWMKTHDLDEHAELLYPSAAKTAHDLVSILAERGIHCTAWPVYESREKIEFSDEAKRTLTLNSLDGVLLYSPKTARCFNRLFEKLSGVEPSFDIFVLSSAIADELNIDLRRKAHVSAEPNEASLFELIDHDPT